MEYLDIMQLMAEYGSFLAAVFVIAYAPISLWTLFKDIADPHYKQD